MRTPDRRPGVKLVTDYPEAKPERGPLLSITAHADDLDLVLSAAKDQADAVILRAEPESPTHGFGRSIRDAARRVLGEVESARNTL